MTTHSRYVERIDEDGLEQFLPIFTWAFCVDSEVRARRWFDRARLENLRGIEAGGRLVAGLAHIPMGQWFGGRCVPCTGIAGVMVEETARSTGVGRELMRASLREQHEAGIALSTLYPATVAFYRDAGYGLAGSRCGHRVPCTALPAGRPELDVHTLPLEELERLAPPYRDRARLSSGFLDRGPYIWFKVHHPQEKPARCYVVEEQGRITGYTFAQERRGPVLSHHYEIHLTDLVALTPAAGRSLLAFLRGHRSMGTHVEWFGDPVDPAVGLLPDRGFETVVDDRWMLRIVDLSAALTSRGYSAAVRGEIHLEVRDEVLPANQGRWVLAVEDGCATVEPGGRGDVTVSVDGLAPLYTGYCTAEMLRVTGALEGSDDACARASALFAGPHPCMPDIF